MQRDIKEFLDELYNEDINLKNDEKNIIDVINIFKSSKPKIKIDENFKNNLRNEIFEEIKNKKINSLKNEKKSIKNILLIFGGIWIAAFWIFAINKDLFLNIDKIAILPKTTKVEIVDESNLETINLLGNSWSSSKNEITNDFTKKVNNIETNILENKNSTSKNTKNEQKTNSKKVDNNLSSRIIEKNIIKLPENNSWVDLQSPWLLKSANFNMDVNTQENSDEIDTNEANQEQIWLYWDSMVAWASIQYNSWYVYKNDFNLYFSNELLVWNHNNLSNIIEKLWLTQNHEFDYKNKQLYLYYNNYNNTIDITYSTWFILKTNDYKKEISAYLNDLNISNNYTLSKTYDTGDNIIIEYILRVGENNIYNQYWENIITTFIIEKKNNSIKNIQNLDINEYEKDYWKIISDKISINKYLEKNYWNNSQKTEIENTPRVIYVKYNIDFKNYIWPAVIFKKENIIIILDERIIKTP